MYSIITLLLFSVSTTSLLSPKSHTFQSFQLTHSPCRNIFPRHSYENSISEKICNNFQGRRMDSLMITLLSSTDDHDDDKDHLKKIEEHKFSNESKTVLTSRQKTEFEKWGVTHLDNSNTQHCPQTIEDVAEASFDCISSTIYNQQKPDPNILMNSISESVLERRPVGFAYGKDFGRDVGRLGIEIDGARFLLNGEKTPQNCRAVDLEGKALRRFSLMLGARLSTSPWEGLEVNDSNVNSFEEGKKKTRPVALFFNTIRQSLLASLELQQMKKDHSKNYDDIRILCLGRDAIPEKMILRKNKGRKEYKKGGLMPQNGIVIVVQPSDYCAENLPPSPSVGSLSALQSLLAKASTFQIPSIVISPRLSEHCWIEQSGYLKSSTYGGVEPPKGPTPWILRRL